MVIRESHGTSVEYGFIENSFLGKFGSSGHTPSDSGERRLGTSGLRFGLPPTSRIGDAAMSRFLVKKANNSARY
jgi:hypothetical protein